MFIKSATFILGILIAMAGISADATKDEDAIVTDSQIVVIDIILNCLVNIYGTNQLIVDSYGNGGIPQKEALAAVQRNKEFLKVINVYAMQIKRQGAKGDKKTTEFINKITEVCTALDMHLGSMVDFIEKNDKPSITQLEKNRERVETLIEELVTHDLE